MADLPPNKEAAAFRRVLISYYAGLLMMVGWMIFSAWTHPQARTTYLLQALLLMLLVSLNLGFRAQASQGGHASLKARVAPEGGRSDAAHRARSFRILAAH